jgi:hypothetical protein
LCASKAPRRLWRGFTKLRNQVQPEVSSLCRVMVL